MPPQAATRKPLPSKETSLFKELLNLYETRQLKKGVKTADQILKKFPDHGETLCMKGLILIHQGKRDEGVELVKKGIRLDLTSHICWHVFGLVQKGEKNYEEALKSYTQALKFDRDNLNLLQDAANLQSQLRLYDALQETRESILRIRPNIRRNWVALAVAYHLNGNLAEARTVLDNYERVLKNVPDYDVEHSEVMMYHVRLLEELGEYREALTLLDANAKARVIVDRTAILEARARLLSRLDDKAEAEHAWKSLIEKNAESYEYYHGFFRVKGTPIDTVQESRETILQGLDELANQLPRATAPRRLALDVSIGVDFRVRIREYLLNGLKRGIPSLFSDVKSLYSRPEKRQIIEEVVADVHHSLEPSDQASANGISSESPTTYLWSLYYLAQHDSHLHRYQKALQTVDIAMKHTPTLPELYTCKARVLKRAGDLFGAVQNIEEARRLDGQDRFLNTKSAKYHLRAGLIDEALAILGLFSRKDAISPGIDLEEMQSLLYLTEHADSLCRLGKLGPSLKKYLAIQKVLEDMYNDQYDFHSYAIRKFTINIYFNLLQWEDNLRSHPSFIHSALRATEIYVKVHDNPRLASPSHSSSSRTEAEKKAQKKAKKAAAKSQEDVKKATASAAVNEDKGLEPPTPKDEDPDGYKALAAGNLLDQAWKLLKPLVAHGSNRIDVWITVYDVAIRRSKYLEAAKAILQAHSINATDPELHVRAVDFKRRVTTLGEPLAPAVHVVISTALSKLLPDELALETFNSQFLQRHSTSAKAVLASGKASRLLGTPLTEVENTIFGLLGPDVAVDIKTAQDALAFLTSIQSPRAEEFRGALDAHFALSTVFKSPEELARLLAELRQFGNADEPPEDKGKEEVDA